MKKLLLMFLVLTAACVHAQVKVGNNPNTITNNSMLELESTDKGILIPRVALNNVDSAAPLRAPVAEGMMVYSASGSLSNGFYYWNGTKWASVVSSTKVRSNHVIVKSAADFPAASGGVRTLAANTVYEINGTVAISDKINLNQSVVQGANMLTDMLVYTGTAELFTGSNCGSIKNMTIVAAATGAKVFNINVGGAAQNMIIEKCLIANCYNVGTIKGVGGTTLLQTIGYQNNTTGITFENDFNLIILNTLWDSNNKGTYEKFVGTFNVIQKTGGDMLTLSANSAIAFDVSGIVSLAAGELKTTLFQGTGTYVTGTFAKQWEVEATGIATEKDGSATGNVYVSATAVTDIVTKDVPVKVAGTTTSATLFRVTMPSNNRLTYTGLKTRRFQVVCSLTAVAASSNKSYSFHIFKNGVKLAESTQSMKMGSGINAGSLTISCTVSMAPNDYIEVWAENNTDTTDLTVENLNVSIK